MYDYDYFEFDSNEDGYPDTYVEIYDTNGDGNYDTMTMVADTNGDGYAETTVCAVDTNHSGQFDTVVTQQDTNVDGEIDIVQKAHDYNQDGQIDSITTHTDTNNDGYFDNVTKSYDSTGDGEIDKMDVYVDVHGTGHADYHEAYNYDPLTGQLIPVMAAGLEIGGTMYTELETYQPNEDYPDGISGDPKESMAYWEYQGDTNRCALYSQKFVIEELSPDGTEIDIEEFAQIAKDHGWFTEEGGTTFLNMNNMLDYYGIDNEMVFHQSISDIEDCLNEGGKVIVSIDCHEIWYGEDNNIFAPESSSNHAVEVIGIDRTNPEHPMVILNDSGSPNGRGEMIPLEVFEGAWEDGDCQMIKCYPSK
mgnify:FL=1